MRLILEVHMKLINVTVEGLPLFKEKLDLSLFAQQRVREDDLDVLMPLFSNVYSNPTNAFIGINASGKTSVLKVIVLALGILNNEPINHIKTCDILGAATKVIMNIYFYTNAGEMCRLETVITSDKKHIEGTEYSIVEEKLWTKMASEVKSRKTLMEFGPKNLTMIRDDREEFLSEDVSIMIAYNKKSKEYLNVLNLLEFTDRNELPFSEDIPAEVIKFLDPTVESLHFEKKDQKALIHLKFIDKDEIVLNNTAMLNHYLSSGTIKGMIIFTLAKVSLQTGGYLIVDEIENHFNKEIASTLIRFFMDTKLNKNRGVLIFSTHYPELLDEYDRNDSIFITRNGDGITVENLCNILKRNDIKKSDAYQSGFLEGTTPMYEAYMELKKSFLAALN